MSTEIKLSHTADGTPCARLYLGRAPITGKQIRPYREFPGMTDEEATRAAEDWQRSIADTYEKDAQKTGALLARYVDDLETRKSPYNTIKTYRLYNRRYAAPLAKVPVQKVTAANLDDLFTVLLTKGPHGGKPLANATVKKFREYLRGAFNSFVRLGILNTNPVGDTMQIPASRAEAHALDESDVMILKAELDRILAESPDTNIGVIRRNAAFGMLLALNTGARVGEVCAIRRRDVRLTGRTVSINGTVIEREGTAERQDHTKGKKPRNVAIDEATAEAIRGHISWQRGYLGTTDRNTPICTVDGRYMSPSTLSWQYSRLRVALSLDPLTTFHSLRHTHATMLLTAGVDIRTVSERLGHAQVSTTLETYAHVMAGRDQRAADMFGELLEFST